MRIALTFDDGPDVCTEAILDSLAQYGQHGTFFIICDRIAAREDIVRRTLADGHEIGVHGWTHRSRPHLTDAELREEFGRSVFALAQLGYVPTLWRAPHHASTPEIDAIGREMGLSRVGADLDPGDWHRDADAIVHSIRVNAKEGDIVDLHDGVPDGESGSRAATVAAVHRVLDAGYKSVTVSALWSAH